MSKAEKHSIAAIENSIADSEMDYLREALKLSYKERFLMATRLYKINKTMQKAVITHNPFIAK